MSRLGFSAFDPQGAGQVSIEFSRVGPNLRAVLRSASSSGAIAERQLEDADASCQPLAEATVFAVSVMVDPQLRATAPAPDPEPKVAASEQTPRPAPHAPTAPSLSWQFGVGAGGAAGVSLSGVAPSMLLHVGATGGRLSLALELRYDWPTTRPAGAGTLTGNIVAGNFVPCVTLDRFELCGVVTLGAMVGSSVGLLGQANLATAIVLLGTRAAANFRLSRWLVISPWIDVLATLTRVALIVDGATVWATGPVSGLAGARISVPWP
jgi:hypothetical protein